MTPRLSARLAAVAIVVVLAPLAARADSVAQVQTAKRLSRPPVVLIDPPGRPRLVPARHSVV